MSDLRMRALAHDLRAPLGAIAATAETLLAHADDPAATRRAALRISAACTHLLRLAEELMAPEERAPEDVVCTPAALCREATGLYGARVALRLTGECDIPVRADAQAVRRILGNLLSNAVKYTPGDGRVELEAAARREDGLCRVRFAVRDEGIGMSGETLKTLFTPYARGEEARTFAGTGLGLCGAQELARRMDGEITAKSRLGEGSEFAFTAAFALAEGEPLAGKRFLVAEDNDLARDALCELLADHGASAVPAQDGEQAVALFAQSAPGTFDAILMDMLLPGLDGCDAARAIRRMDRPDAPQVLILALTGAAAPEAVQRARESGMDAHALKPVTMARLGALLALARDARRAAQEEEI